MLAGCLPSVNIGQSSFEAVAQIVRKVQGIETHKNDRHGRNSLLTTYIQYTCTLPYVDSGQRGRDNCRVFFFLSVFVYAESMYNDIRFHAA